MASFTLTSTLQFPNGTSVGAYPETNWPGGSVNKRLGPVGSADDTETMTAGELTFTGLTELARYVAYAFVSSEHRYVSFIAGADTPGGPLIGPGTIGFRELADNTKPSFNVMEYGAGGEGTDDLDAVNDALAAAEAAGGGTVLCPGHHLLSEAITKPQGVAIVGLGPGKSVLEFTEDVEFGIDCEVDAGVGTLDHEHQLIANLTIKGVGATPSTGSGVRWVSNLVLFNCHVEGFEHGLYVWGDHQAIAFSNLTLNTYGVWVADGQPTEWDQSYIKTEIAGNTFAGIGIEAGAVLSAEMFDVHFGFEDHAIYAEAGAPFEGCIDGLALHSCYAESFGTSFITTNNRWINDLNWQNLRLRPNEEFDGAGALAATPVISVGTGGIQDVNGDGLLMFDPPSGDTPLDFIGAATMRRISIRGASRFINTVADWSAANDGWPIFGSNGTVEDVEIEWGGGNRLIAVKTSEAVNQYDSVGLAGYSGLVRLGQQGESGNVPLGIAMYDTLGGFTCAVQTHGIITANSGANAISEGAYVKIDSTGIVEAASSAADLPILGVAGDGGAASNLCPVDLRIAP